MLPALREPLRLRFGEQNLHISAAGFRPRCRPAVPSLCSPLPANPCSSVSGSKIFTFPSSASPSRPPGGALSLLPAPRKPLQLRSGEQNLHISAVGFRPPRRSAALSLCSPLPANPCSSISGSKIFTFPPPDFVLPGARRLPLFAPRYPQTLAAPFRGAKSSHFRRRISPSLPPGGALSLLPATRKPLQLRSGEQNLHIPAAGFRPPRRPAASALCSPLPASPCGSVPGSKIFTFPPPDFVLSGARRPPLFAPRSLRTLVAPFRGAKSSHFRRRFAAGFRPPRRPAASALCSPLSASPCGSVPGSKIFTFPPPDFVLPSARRPPLFAPRSPRTLVAPFRGAKSSHFRRPISTSLSPGGSMLPKTLPHIPEKPKSTPSRLYFFCTSLKSGHFGPQNRLLGLFPCRMKFAKKFYSAILSIRKDALGALYFYAWHFAHLRRACAPLSPSAPLLKLCVL